ncbi:MAG: oligogalacturonate lyase family protein, partial [Lentisphaerae bacterium]|nr:oligogalacturonate lyase family protein [Lentisphaerota bacterium]
SDGSVEKIEFPRTCWHSHSSRDGRLIIGDSHNGFYRGCASTVHFMNRDSGRVIVMAEHAAQHNYAGRNYHVDPHPRFCCNDQYVVFTTTIRGEVDLAILPVQDLLEKTS